MGPPTGNNLNNRPPNPQYQYPQQRNIPSGPQQLNNRWVSPAPTDEERPDQFPDNTDGGTRFRVDVNTNITTSSQSHPEPIQGHSYPYNQNPRQGQPPNARTQRYNQTTSHTYSTTDREESTTGLVTSFMVNRMEYDGVNVPNELARRARNIKIESQVADALIRMGDELANNRELNDLIGSIDVTPGTAYAKFAAVAARLFRDGVINWGRVVSLLYFAYKLAVQVVDRLPLIDMVIGWVTKYIVECLFDWIMNNGGWESVKEYFGSPTTQFVCVFLAGVFLSSLFWYINR